MGLLPACEIQDEEGVRNLRVHIVTDVDEGTWEAFVADHPAGSLLQTAAWARFKQEWNWDHRRLLVRHGDTPIGGAQVLLRRLPLGRSLAYVPHGPVMAPEQEVVQEALWPALHELARAEKALLLTIEPKWPMRPEEAAQVLAPAGLTPGTRDVQPRATMILDVRPSEDEILMNMKSKWRYNIRLSGRKGVDVRVGGADDFACCYEMMAETGERNDFNVRPRGYYESAWAAFQPERSRLFIAEFDGEPLAWLMAFRHGSSAYYLYGASSGRERNRMPNHALQWAAIRWAKESGCTHYDFWGIPAEVPADGNVEVYGTGGLWGVFRFKQGFGGDVVKYPGAFDAVYNALAYKFYKMLQGE